MFVDFILREPNNNIDNSIQITDLINGKLPNRIVKAIYQLVETNDNFKKHISPNLDTSNFKDVQPTSNLNAYKTQENENLINQTEHMMKKIMDSINVLIEEQVRMRTCIPLRPDLEKFLFQLNQHKTNTNNINLKFEFPKSTQNQRLHERFSRSAIDNGGVLAKTKLHHEYSIVNKLLAHFDKLPIADKIKINGVKPFLEKHIILLDELKSEIKRTNSNRSVRSTNSDVSTAIENANGCSNTSSISKEADSKNNNTTTYLWLTDDEKSSFSNQFMKLTRTADLLRFNSLHDVDNFEYEFYDNL